MAIKKADSKIVETLTHGDASRKNIPTAEHESIMYDADKSPVRIAYERRNRDLDPQLVWRGKDEQDWSDLVVQAPPLYIQEKVHPKVLIDDLLRRSKADKKATEAQIDLFADFDGLPNESAKTEFYQHDAHWANRMILGDSLQVMASLAEREGLRGKVQCIYFDPPYGIKFNSNFQWSTTSSSYWIYWMSAIKILKQIISTLSVGEKYSTLKLLLRPYMMAKERIYGLLGRRSILRTTNEWGLLR